MPLMLIDAPSETDVEAVRQVANIQVLAVVKGPTQGSVPVDAPAPARQSVASLIGSISPEAGKRMLREVAEMRDEWERE